MDGQTVRGSIEVQSFSHNCNHQLFSSLGQEVIKDTTKISFEAVDTRAASADDGGHDPRIIRDIKKKVVSWKVAILHGTTVTDWL